MAPNGGPLTQDTLKNGTHFGRDRRQPLPCHLVRILTPMDEAVRGFARALEAEIREGQCENGGDPSSRVMSRVDRIPMSVTRAR